VLFILLAILWGYESPLVPIQILWLNLTTDGAPAIALAVEMVEPGIMDEGPRPRSEPIIEKVLICGMIIHNIVLTACTLFTYIVGLYWETGNWDGSTSATDGVSEKKAQTMCILYIVFAELLRAYGSRSLRRSLFTIGWFSNKYMQYAVFVAVALTILIAVIPGVQDIFNLAPISGKEWGFVIGFCFVPLFIDEVTKMVYRHIGFGERPKAVQRPQALATSSGGAAEAKIDIEVGGGSKISGYATLQ